MNFFFSSLYRDPLPGQASTFALRCKTQEVCLKRSAERNCEVQKCCNCRWL